MRILCLNLKKTSNVTLADIFLKFSPRVQFRKPNWLFIDITSTIPLFQSEEILVEECLNICRTLGIPVTAAIADTPWGAQVLTEFHERVIVTPGEEQKALGVLPVSALTALEGLEPWNCPSTHILQIASFFQMIGLPTLAHIRHLNKESFSERWGDVGTQMWRRLHNLEKQFISPWLPQEPLHFYQYLNFPISLLPFLLHSLEKSLLFLFARLQGRNLFAQRIVLTLRCEYSAHVHTLTLQPAAANRDLPLFMTLLEQKLAKVDLDNPIREFEVDVISCEEQQRQLNFEEARSTEQDNLQRLMSLLQQSDCEAGFFQLRNGVFPEKTWVHGSRPVPRPTRLLSRASVQQRLFGL